MLFTINRGNTGRPANCQKSIVHLVSTMTGVRKWNDRKRRLLKPEHLKLAWQRLREQGWDTVI